jgi:hypothetical protein
MDQQIMQGFALRTRVDIMNAIPVYANWRWNAGQQGRISFHMSQEPIGARPCPHSINRDQVISQATWRQHSTPILRRVSKDVCGMIGQARECVRRQLCTRTGASSLRRG